MEPEYEIRKATTDDAEFLADVIIGAEKSMTETLGLAKVFELSENYTKELIIRMLKEDVDGCEFSPSSFLIASLFGKPVAAMGGWLEGYFDKMPSVLIKSNLIMFVFPKENILHATEKLNLIKGMQFEREMGTYQLEYVYVDPLHRGKELAGLLMASHLRNARVLDPGIRKVQAQVFESNKSSLKHLEKTGYVQVDRLVSDNLEILKYLPHNIKILLEKLI